MTGRVLGSRQFHVGPLASADCSAGIPDGDALYLVRSRFQSLRGGVNDVGFHPLPIGDAAKAVTSEVGRLPHLARAPGTNPHCVDQAPPAVMLLSMMSDTASGREYPVALRDSCRGHRNRALVSPHPNCGT